MFRKTKEKKGAGEGNFQSKTGGGQRVKEGDKGCILLVKVKISTRVHSKESRLIGHSLFAPREVIPYHECYNRFKEKMIE
jgi:hypothetical protein